MSKKVKLKKGTTPNLQELSIDTGKKVVQQVVKDESLFGQLSRFLETDIGKKLVNVGIDIMTQQLVNIMNPNPQRSSPLESGNREGAVIPRSPLHERVFKVLNSIDHAQLKMIEPVLEMLSNPSQMQKMLKTIDPNMIQTLMQTFLGGK